MVAKASTETTSPAPGTTSDAPFFSPRTAAAATLSSFSQTLLTDPDLDEKNHNLEEEKGASVSMTSGSSAGSMDEFDRLTTLSMTNYHHDPTVHFQDLPVSISIIYSIKGKEAG